MPLPDHIGYADLYEVAPTSAIDRSGVRKLNEWMEILSGHVSITDFGGVGDGVTDNTAALNAAIEQIKSKQNAAGFYGGEIVFPVGVFSFTETIVVADDGGDVVTAIRFRGQGGYVGEGGTRLQWLPSVASTKGIQVLSGQNIVFEDIEFVSGNNNVSTLIEVNAQVSPTFSGFMTEFNRCGIRHFNGTAPSFRLIHVLNAALTNFRQCWIGGTAQIIRLGETTAGPPLASSYEGSNTAGNTRFEQCQLYADIEMVNVLGLYFDQTIFGRSNPTTPVKIYPAASGFVRNDHVSFVNSVQGNVTDTVVVDFFTQGTNASFPGDLVALNCRFDGYRVTFVLTNGTAVIEGCYFGPPTNVAAVKAITFAAAVSAYARFGNNDFSALVTAGFTSYITDNRLTGIQPQIIGADVVIADDQVGVFMTVPGRTALLSVAAASATGVSLFAVDAAGTNEIVTMFLGASCLNGGLATPAPGAGTDGNAIVYIGTDGIIRISNRLGFSTTFRATLIPLGKTFP